MTYIVSVIIPTYNSRGGLVRSIESVLAQDFRNYEIIVVDDNDPTSEARARTEKEMAAYKQRTNFRYIKHEYNKNGAAARNTGIFSSRGTYIAFLDDDDEFLQNKLQRQVDYLNNHSEYDAVYCLSTINGKDEFTIPFEGDASIPLLKCRTKMVTPALMFRRSALITINGFDEQFRRHQDYQLLLSYFEHGFKIGCLQERLTAIHSFRGNSLTIDELIELKSRYLAVFQPLINRLEACHPGIANEIIAANYAGVFDAAIACKEWKKAWDVFRNYFPVAPLSFISQCWFLMKDHVRRKL